MKYTLFILLITLIISNSYSQNYSQIIDLNGSPDAKLECLIELPDSAGFILSSEDSVGNSEIIMLDINTDWQWSQCLTSYSTNLEVKNNRLAYNDSVIMFVGQNRTTNKPAYTLLRLFNGAVIESKEISDSNGIINGVHSSKKYGFFIAGYLDFESEDRGIVGRIDYGAPSNNWLKVVDADQGNDSMNI